MRLLTSHYGRVSTVYFTDAYINSTNPQKAANTLYITSVSAKDSSTIK